MATKTQRRKREWKRSYLGKKVTRILLDDGSGNFRQMLEENNIPYLGELNISAPNAIAELVRRINEMRLKEV